MLVRCGWGVGGLESADSEALSRTSPHRLVEIPRALTDVARAYARTATRRHNTYARTHAYTRTHTHTPKGQRKVKRRTHTRR